MNGDTTLELTVGFICAMRLSLHAIYGAIPNSLCPWQCRTFPTTEVQPKFFRLLIIHTTRSGQTSATLLQPAVSRFTLAVLFHLAFMVCPLKLSLPTTWY